MQSETPDLQSVVERLVERQNRSLRFLCAVATILAVVALIVATLNYTRRTLQAQRFLLTDGNGVLRGSLDVTSEGGPAFHLYDATGKDRVAIGSPENGAFIVLARDKAHIAIVDDNDQILWSAPAQQSTSKAAQVPPCPSSDPVGLFLKDGCTPLPPTK
jgi:hypothetical protein